MLERTRAQAESIARFWERVDKSTEPDGCWVWTHTVNQDGYGQTTVSGFRTHSAHRIAYELCVEPIPPGLYIDHRCHNRACVNPDHLRLATQKQNMENRSPAAYRSAASNVRGVCKAPHSNRWRARVKHYQREIQIGTFDTIEEAEAAVIAARNALFTHNDEDRVAG